MKPNESYETTIEEIVRLIRNYSLRDRPDIHGNGERDGGDEPHEN